MAKEAVYRIMDDEEEPTFVRTFVGDIERVENLIANKYNFVENFGYNEITVRFDTDVTEITRDPMVVSVVKEHGLHTIGLTDLDDDVYENILRRIDEGHYN